MLFGEVRSWHIELDTAARGPGASENTCRLRYLANLFKHQSISVTGPKEVGRKEDGGL